MELDFTDNANTNTNGFFIHSDNIYQQPSPQFQQNGLPTTTTIEENGGAAAAREDYDAGYRSLKMAEDFNSQHRDVVNGLLCKID